MSKTKPARSFPSAGDGMTPHDHSQLTMSQDKEDSKFSEAPEYGADETQQLKDELLRIRALAQDYVAAEQRLRKARAEDSEIEWHEALEDVLDARSALVPHVYPAESSNRPTRAELEAENERLRGGIQEAKQKLQLLAAPLTAFQEARVSDALRALYRAEGGDDA